MRPVVYFANLFSEGVVSGSRDTTTNQARRVGDGSINLEYTATSGAVPSGAFAVTMPTAVLPDSFVLASGVAPSGTLFILESEDADGSNNAAVVSATTAAQVESFAYDIPQGATPRRRWRVVVSGVSGAAQLVVNEFMLATKFTFPRSPEVGVSRTRVRQFGRLAIPGGAPFVKREGGNLRRLSADFVVISGTELDSYHGFITEVEGGQAFYLTDDLGSSYWAELMGREQPQQDQAGVHRARLTFQEIKAG